MDQLRLHPKTAPARKDPVYGKGAAAAGYRARIALPPQTKETRIDERGFRSRSMK